MNAPEKYRNPHRRNNEHYGENLTKRVYLADRCSITAEDVPDHLNAGVGSPEEKQAFADSLPMSICYAGRTGLNNAFIEFLNEQKSKR